MNYAFKCTYYSDSEGTIKSCLQQYTDGTQSKEYSFYIEFVTFNRAVVKSIILDDYFFMIDSQAMYSLMRF